jgi:hypothetical protein
VALKGMLIPVLILRLYRYRQRTPVLANGGLILVTVALVVALGQWIGWMAGVIQVTGSRG